jgi:hypothetical protein
VEVPDENSSDPSELPTSNIKDDNIFDLPKFAPTTSPTSSKTKEPTINPDIISDINQIRWGPNVYFINNSMTIAQIQSFMDEIFQKQVNNEMGTERYGIYFSPGVYGSKNEPLMIQLAYYTELAGLGKFPTDVVIYGKIEVYNRCFKSFQFHHDGQFIPSDGSGHCIALNNFWRSLSNLSVQIISRDQDFCRSKANFWAVSQASSMRRVSFNGGDVSLMDYCTMPAYASGGFLSDSIFSGQIENGSQQQWISRNIVVKRGWSGSVWNQVFLGSVGVPSGNSFPDPAFTTLERTPLSREKPFIFVKDNEFFVYVPRAITSTIGSSWDTYGNNTPGKVFSLDTFFVVTPSMPALVQRINVQLQRGKHLLFTPGVYDIDDTITVSKGNTVVLGMGHATLTAINGVIPLTTSDAPGIILAGITIDAGDVESPVLLQVGPSIKDGEVVQQTDNPITLSDVYIRIGGPHVGKCQVAIEINSDHVLIDHIWIWRADHGKSTLLYVPFLKIT